MKTFGRPRKEREAIIEARNMMILACVNGGTVEFQKGELNQSDTALIFRLPRNTVSFINKKYKK